MKKRNLYLSLLSSFIFVACSASDAETDEAYEDYDYDYDYGYEEEPVFEDDFGFNDDELVTDETIEEAPAEPKFDMSELNSINTVNFDFDRQNIRVEFTNALDKHAEYLIANPNANALIEGHTDDRGSQGYNIALGDRRATSVMNYLVDQGVSRSQLQIQSYGEDKPIDFSRTEAGYAKNRRAVIIHN